MSNRWGHKVWGADAPRRFFGEHHWNEPVRWNLAAEHAGERHRTFPSMCDPFERREDLDAPRRRMFELIDQTPWLDWLLVTKRPENILSMWPGGIDGYRSNVWLLTSTENQEAANQRIPPLLACRRLVPVLGLSAEPLLGPIDLDKALGCGDSTHRGQGDANCDGLDWVIGGGESGPGARPCETAWLLSLVSQCRSAAVAPYVKQLGSNPRHDFDGTGMSVSIVLNHPKGGDPAEWPAPLRVQEFPEVAR